MNKRSRVKFMELSLKKKKKIIFLICWLSIIKPLDSPHMIVASVLLALIIFTSLFSILFISFTALFGTIHGFYCTISANFYFYLQYFQQKVFSFSKISKSQIDPKCVFGKNYFFQINKKSLIMVYLDTMQFISNYNHLIKIL